MFKFTEKFFVILIGVTLLLPAPLTIWIHAGNPPPQFNWIANRSLVGVTLKEDSPPATLASWLSGDFQKGLGTLASDNFAGRELLIRVYNQILYRVFEKSYMTSEFIIKGKHGDIFTDEYLAQYGRFIEPLQSEEGEALVVMMKYLSKRLKESGSCFVFLITPSKATLYPEDIPERYLTKLKRGDRTPSSYEIMVPLLKTYAVPFVDGRQITLEHKRSLPVSAFPKTGIHWCRAAAFFTAADLLKMLEKESGQKMPLLSETVESINDLPDYSDADIFDLMNLIDRPRQRFLHPTIQIPENWIKRRGLVTFVGGSFISAMAEDLEMAKVFARMNIFYYFELGRFRYPGSLTSSVSENSIPWKEEFWSSTAVVLEANEEAFGSRHIPAFLMAELAAFEEKMPQKERVDDSPRPLSWGFGSGQNGTTLAKKGFSEAGPDFTCISEEEAEIDLPSPEKNAELELILQGAPFARDVFSGRVIKVFANGSQIGSFEPWSPEAQIYSFTIQAAVNRGPLVNIHFSVSPPRGSVRTGNEVNQLSLYRLSLVPIKVPKNTTAGPNGAPVPNRE